MPNNPGDHLKRLYLLLIPGMALALAACGGGGNDSVTAASQTAGTVSNSAATLIATDSAPVITSQPASLSVSAGQGAQFSVSASSSVTETYQWQQAGANIAGATAASYSLPDTTLSDSGEQFSVIVSNVAGSVTSSTATLTVLPIPAAITAQPASTSVSAGQPAVFSVGASGTLPLSYQWFAGGVSIAGATGASYSIAATTLSQSGSQFTVTVSNPGGSVTSSAATLAVNPIAPTLTAQPASSSVSAGQPALFSVTATGSAPLSYQWQRGGVAISGATASSYSLSTTALSDSGAQFNVIVTNAAGSVTSSIATLTVNAIAPAITSQPASLTVSAGQPAMFSVTASGTAPLSYQWQRGGASIAGATAASYSLASTALSDSGAHFGVVVTNAGGSVTSSAATLTVNAIAPVIVTQPQSQTAFAGSTASFSVVATGTAPLSYQWQQNGANIAGATAASYTTPVLATSSSGSAFDVIVSNGASTVATSGTATLTVNPVAPAIVTQPQSQTVSAGSTASFSVVASGTAPLSYQWQQNGANIAGANAASYTTPTLTTSSSGSSFDVIVSNAASSTATSNAVTLTVTATPPAITTQPQPQTVEAGNSATFSVVATGSAPLSYQWLKNGANIIGATASSYTTPAAAARDSGSTFSVVVNNAANAPITSSGVALTVTHTLTLVAGELGGAGHANGTGTAATFYGPGAVASDSAGNIYVADGGNQMIRVITPAGVVSTLAGTPGVQGSTNGTGAAALFNSPNQLAVDASGNVYVADSGNNVIRMITSGGVVSTYAGTAGVSGSSNSPGALFNSPKGVAVYQPVVPGPVTLYVADSGNNTIREISSSGQVTTLAGSAGVSGSNDGTGSAAQFAGPGSLIVDPATGNIYVADTYNDTIRRITSGAVVTTIAGSVGGYGSNDGTGAAAQFNEPTSVALDAGAVHLYVSDTNNQTIRQITTSGDVVTTIAGSAGNVGATNGTGSAARFEYPTGVAIDPSGNLYVADSVNYLVRKISMPGATVTTLAGNIGGRGYQNGTAGAARFNDPHYVATDPFGNIFVSDHYNNVIRMITPAGVVTTLAGTAGPGGFQDSPGALFNSPYGIATDASGNVYVADSGNNAIREIAMPSGTVSTIAGGSAGSANGTGSAAQFNEPYAVALNAAGDIFVADFNNNTIRMIAPGGVVTTFAGSAGNAGSTDGTGATARFWGPRGIATDSSGNVYVADRNNGTVRMITPTGVVSTLAGTAGVVGFEDGTGGAAQFDWPNGPIVDASDNVYVADALNHAIRKITPAGVVTTIAGAPPGAALSYSVVPGTLPASLDQPSSVAVLPGPLQQLIINDAVENSILLITLP
jgi:DNA-binding beta-propeller fold protein YncE